MVGKNTQLLWKVQEWGWSFFLISLQSYALKIFSLGYINCSCSLPLESNLLSNLLWTAVRFLSQQSLESLLRAQFRLWVIWPQRIQFSKIGPYPCWNLSVPWRGWVSVQIKEHDVVSVDHGKTFCHSCLWIHNVFKVLRSLSCSETWHLRNCFDGKGVKC